MRKTPLSPGKPLDHHSRIDRKPTKRSQPRRDWKDARAKVEQEGVCRVGRLGDCSGPLQAAHIIGRERDAFWSIEQRAMLLVAPEPREQPWHVHPDRIVPLCKRHHDQFDAHELELLGALHLSEQLQAVADAGGLELARTRLCPTAYRQAA